MFEFALTYSEPPRLVDRDLVSTLCAWARIRFVLQSDHSARKAAEEQGITVRGDGVSILIVLRLAVLRRLSAGFFKDTKSVFGRVWCLRARVTAFAVRRAAIKARRQV